MFKYILKKEFLLLSRDIHALLVLFIMPTIFILIMSLALKNTYSSDIDVKSKIGIIAQETKDILLLNKEFNKSAHFESIIIKNKNYEDLIYKNNFEFLIKISNTYKIDIKTNKKNFEITIFSKADSNIQNYEILRNTIVKIISKSIMKDFFIKNKINAKTLSTLDLSIKKVFVYKNNNFKVTPNSVQQSVPAWLVFSMFFILIPISNTFISEKSLGTIDRIRSINVSLLPILLGKMIPYFVVNQIQVVLMILVGIFVVPLFGGDKLVISNNYFLIFCMSSAISFAAISFALLIANISKTTEEATSIGGVTNIILAALGGIMVPKFVMPLFMQEITYYSPMSWGLEGLLEIFVRGGGFLDIRNYMLFLFIFGLCSLCISFILLTIKRK